MTAQTLEALATLKELGTTEAIWEKAKTGVDGAAPRVNSHIHLPPNFSAFESVEQAVGLAQEQGVGVLGVSNYYDYDVYNDFAALARRAGIFPLYGLEIIALDPELAERGIKMNDPGNPGKLYICGKGTTRFGAATTARGQELLDLIRQKDSTRMAALVAKLEEIFAAHGLPTGLDEQRVVEMIVRRHGSRPETVYLQERHACQAFQEAFFDKVPARQRVAKLSEIFGAPYTGEANDHVKVQNDIRAQLLKKGKAGYVPETFITPREARELILEMGGIPCYPTLADGVKPICPYEENIEKLIENIKAEGIYCAELIPIRNSPEVLTQYVTALRAAGIVVTAGTEHNTLDLLPIEPTCVGGVAIPEGVMAIFREGANVVAAHQFLTLNGEVGYVDAQGRLNAAYADDETRIRGLNDFGAALIQTYFEAR